MRTYLGAATAQGDGTPAAGVTILDTDGADFKPISTADAGPDDPMYLALSSDGDKLYVSHAIADGAVSAWRIDGDSLIQLGPAQSTGGATPCYVSIDLSGRYLLNANYDSGSVSVHPILADGSLGEISDLVQHTGSGPHPRQRTPHAHMIVTDPGTGQILAVDLGADAIFRYRLESGKLIAIDKIVLPPGSGPRHVDFVDRTAYVACEIDSTMSVVDLDEGAVIATVSTSPASDAASHPSAIRCTSDGRWALVANRFIDTIAVFDITGSAPQLVHTESCRGDHPRDMTMSPDESYVYSANMFSDSITTFRFDSASGALTPIGDTFSTPSPACVLFTT